jgi:seryl-tRNA synthetase
VISETVKDALREVIRRKTEIANLNTRKNQAAQEIATIDQEQGRIRQNMQSLDRNTDLYNLYIKKFTDQESQVEKLRGEVRELDQQIATAQKSLDDYLMKLELS